MNFTILSKPYPFKISLKRDFFTAFLFGFFVFLFLIVFQPFGLSNYQSETKTLELAGYGLVTFTLLFGNYFLFSKACPKWYSKSSWTVGKNILFTIYIFLVIGCSNMLYSVFVGYVSLSFKGFLYYQFWTLLVGVFPVTISTFIIYNQRLKKAVSQANQLNHSLQPTKEIQSESLQLPSRNKSEAYTTKVQQLICIKSVENYVEVYALNNSKLNKTILRNTLKNIQETLLEFDCFEQCHRSYLVNLDKVQHFNGNAQGLSLHFSDVLELEVPVSRSYVRHIKMKLAQR